MTGRFFLLLLMVGSVNVAQADPAWPEDFPIERIKPGDYATEGGSSFKDSQFTADKWAESFVLTGEFADGEDAYEFRVTLRPYRNFSVRRQHCYTYGRCGEVIRRWPVPVKKQNIFEGSGKILVPYGDVVCRYPIDVVLYSYVDKIYIKDFSPSSFPEALNEDGRCGEMGRRVWTEHPKPYFMKSSL